MKRLLIITYFYPPCAKSGVHRAVKMVKNLPVYGWEPFILTVSDGRWDRIDNKLLEQVQHVRVFRTKQMYPLRNRTFLLARVWRRIWKWITFPDEHIGWVPYAFFAGRKIITENHINALFVTGAPFSSFIIGLALKKSMHIPLFLDYRDPWTSNPAFVNRFKRMYEKLERICLKQCDLFFGATPVISEEIGNKYSPIIKRKERTFTLSYDLAEFAAPEHATSISPDVIRLLLVGNIYDDTLGNTLVQIFKQLKEEHIISSKNVSIESYGNLRAHRSHDDSIKDIIHIHSYIPHHEILKKMAESNGLLLPHGNNPMVEACYPGRMFEYLAVKKPILYIGPYGIAAKAIERSGIGMVANSNDLKEIKVRFTEFIERIKRNDFKPDADFIDSFEVRNVMRKFINDMETSMKVSESYERS